MKNSEPQDDPRVVRSVEERCAPNTHAVRTLLVRRRVEMGGFARWFILAVLASDFAHASDPQGTGGMDKQPMGWQADDEGNGKFFAETASCRPEEGSLVPPFPSRGCMFEGAKEYRTIFAPPDFDIFAEWYSRFDIDCGNQAFQLHCSNAWCCTVAEECPSTQEPDFLSSWVQTSSPTHISNRECFAWNHAPQPSRSVTTAAAAATTGGVAPQSFDPPVPVSPHATAPHRTRTIPVNTTITSSIATDTTTTTTTLTDTARVACLGLGHGNVWNPFLNICEPATPPTTTPTTVTTTSSVSRRLAEPTTPQTTTPTTVTSTTVAAKSSAGQNWLESRTETFLGVIATFVLIGSLATVLADQFPKLIKKRKAAAWSTDVAGEDRNTRHRGGGWVQLDNEKSTLQSADAHPLSILQLQHVGNSVELPVLKIDMLDFESRTNSITNITETAIGCTYDYSGGNMCAAFGAEPPPLQPHNGPALRYDVAAVFEDQGPLLEQIERDIFGTFDAASTPPFKNAPLGQHHNNQIGDGGAAHHQDAPILLPGSVMSAMSHINSSSDDNSSASVSRDGNSSNNSSPVQKDHMCAVGNQAMMHQPWNFMPDSAHVPQPVTREASLPPHRSSTNSGAQMMHWNTPQPEAHPANRACTEPAFPNRALQLPQHATPQLRPTIFAPQGVERRAAFHEKFMSTVAVERDAHDEWKTRKLLLTSGPDRNTGRWCEWVLELSSKQRKEMCDLYDLPENAEDDAGFTVKYASRRFKQNRSQHEYLRKIREKKEAKSAEVKSPPSM